MDIKKLIGSKKSVPSIDFNQVVNCDNLTYWRISNDVWDKNIVELHLTFRKHGIESSLDKTFDTIMEAVEYFYNFLKTNKDIEVAARLDDKEYYDRLSDNDRFFFEYGLRRGYNRALKGLFHPTSKVLRNDNEKFIASSRKVGFRKLYDMNAMLYETTCNTYEEMWKKEVKASRLSDWIFIEELLDLIKKGGNHD